MESNAKEFDLFEGIDLSGDDQNTVADINAITDLVHKMFMRRIELGLTQRDVAKLAGIKQPVLARLEKLTVIPRIDTVQAVLRALRLELNVKPVEEK